jgi:hypothetical protein
MATNESPFTFSGSAKADHDTDIELGRPDASISGRLGRTAGQSGKTGSPAGGPSTNTRSQARSRGPRGYGPGWSQYYSTEATEGADNNDGGGTDQGSDIGVYHHPKPDQDKFAVEWTVLVYDGPPGDHVWNPDLIRHALQPMLPCKLCDVVITTDHSAILFFTDGRGGLSREQVETVIGVLARQNSWIGSPAEVWPRRVPLDSAKRAAKQGPPPDTSKANEGSGDVGLGIPFPGSRSCSPTGSKASGSKTSPRRRRGRRPIDTDLGTDGGYTTSDRRSDVLNNPPRRPIPGGRARLPTFEGGDPNAYRQWRYDLNILLKLGYNEKQIYPEVLMSLKGRAGGVARTFLDGKEPSLKEIVRRLDRYYGGSLTFFAMSRAMHQLVQTKDECIGDFASRINDHLNMMRGSHPEDMKSFAVDKAMKEVLFNGFVPRMKYALRYLRRQPGLSAEDLLGEAQEMEQEEISDKIDRSNRSKRDPIEPLAQPKAVGNGYFARKPKPSTAAVRTVKPTMATYDELNELSAGEDYEDAVPEAAVPDQDEFEDRIACKVVAVQNAYNNRRDAADRQRPPPTTGDRSCFLCKKPGHMMNECPDLKKLQDMAASLAGNGQGGTAQKGNRAPPSNKTPAAVRSVQSELSEI